jgi:Uma2 family endonuclease
MMDSAWMARSRGAVAGQLTITASLTLVVSGCTLAPMADPAKRQATYDDLLAVPEHLVAEIIYGQVVTHPRPASPHARAASKLGARLDGPFDMGEGGPGGWIILDEPELHLGGHVLVPDLAGWRRQRMPEMPDVTAFDIVPDWICEIVSPSTAATDRAEKMPIYASLGAPYLWLLDPGPRTLEVYRLEDARYVVLQTASGNAVLRAEPFDAIELALAQLWAR